MATDQAKPGRLAAVVGRNVRAAREERGWTQDEASRRLRGCALDWNPSALAKFERGERDTLTVEQLAQLALALGATVGQLLDSDEQVVLGRNAQARAGAIAQVLRGEDPPAKHFDMPWMRERRRRDDRGGGAAASRGRDEGQLEISDALLAARGSLGETEIRAARRLGVEPNKVSATAVRLWGRTLTAERDRRAGDGPARTLQARRGHASRQLLDELRQALPKKRSRKVSRTKKGRKR